MSAGHRFLFAVAVCAALIVLTSGAAPPVLGAPTPAAVFVSPAGNDSSRCTQAAPCASFTRAYAVAQPGQTVDIAGGTYPEQNILWRPGRDDAAQVVFRPTGRVTIDGNLRVYASGVRIAGQATGSITNWRSRTYSIAVTRDMAVLGDSATRHPHNVTLEGIDGGSLGTYTSENVVVRDMDVGPVVLNACNRPESKIGPNIDAELFSPRNITWERVVVHGMDRDASAAQAGCHYGGLFVVSASGVTIRESVFTENIVYNIQVQNYVGSPATNVTVQNTWFGCPVLAVSEAPVKTCNGQASIQFNAATTFTDWLIRYNSFAASDATSAGGNRASFSNVRFVGNAGRRPGNDVCRRAGVSFSNNAWVGATCGSSDKSIANPFVNIGPGQEDLHLRPGTRASGLVVGSGADHDVAWDIERRMRPVRSGRDAGSVQRESAEIVPWKAIGLARLAMTREDVLAVYGRPRRSSIRGGVRTDTYRLHGGTVWLRYQDDRTVELGTTSTYYTTRTGLGPGSSTAGARRKLGKWDLCRGVFRRALRSGIVHFRPDRTQRKIVAVSVVRRSAEDTCTKRR
jgi:hypothetical protein